MICVKSSEISTLIAVLITVGVIVYIHLKSNVPIKTFLILAFLMDAPPSSMAATLGKAKNCGALYI